jgi:hypothetical protein
MIYHPNAAELRRKLLDRGRKWVSLNGVHHKHYRGFAALKINNNSKLMKYNVILLLRPFTSTRLSLFIGKLSCYDRQRWVSSYHPSPRLFTPCTATFRRLNPSYTLPISKPPPEVVPNRPASPGKPFSLYNAMVLTLSDYDDAIPTLDVGARTQAQDRELTNDELILTSPIVYGFSLMDKIWRKLSLYSSSCGFNLFICSRIQCGEDP